LKILSNTETPPSKARLEKPYLPEIDPGLVQETEALVSTALLTGMDHARNRLDLADADIPPLPFEEAVTFMKSRVPVTKTEWNAPGPKLRFRAFTVARLAQYDYIEAARQILSSIPTAMKMWFCFLEKIVSHGEAQGIEAKCFRILPFLPPGKKIQADSPVRPIGRMRPNPQI
jgi:hypothetical protein